MSVYNTVKKNTYYDSVSLMVLSSNLSSISGVKDASVMMGTDQNKDLMRRSGLLQSDAEDASSSDMIIGVEHENNSDLSEAQEVIDQFFSKTENDSDQEHRNVKTIESAYKNNPDSNLAVISVPGEYAKSETMKVIERDMNVMLFSDNVPLDEEILLKDKANEKGLLMMGPDCGTAIINNTALGFANQVRKGNIGFVAAAGTGLQEATVQVDRMGGGVSQAIGTGGRDIKEEVGGKMMLKGIELLEQDEETDIIVLISKPPSNEVLKKILHAVEHSEKKVIACLLGADYSLVNSGKVVTTETLEDLASFAVSFAKGDTPESTFFSQDMEDIKKLVEEEVSKLKDQQRYIRGLYSGGTLCYEGMLILKETIGEVFSNVPLKEELMLDDLEVSREHSFLDMGEDYFTEGMPHPMIDTRQRVERIKREAKDEEVSVILLDVVLGYGCHENPAEALAGAIEEAKEIAKNDGREISFVASICGTEKDPQSWDLQQSILEDAGVIVMPSNAQAARLASLIANKGNELEKII